MKLLRELLLEAESTVEYLNCSNCLGIKGQETKEVSHDELNENGGMKCSSTSDKKTAEEVKLITLPGEATGKTKTFCAHPDVKMWVTERMWCNRWDAPGVYRSFKLVEK